MSLRPHLRRTEDKARNLLEQTTWTPAYFNVYDSVQSSRAATPVPPTAPASPKGRRQAANSVDSASSASRKTRHARSYTKCFLWFSPCLCVSVVKSVLRLPQRPAEIH